MRNVSLRRTPELAAVVVFTTVLAVAGPAPAQAACSSSVAMSGISYYDGSDCSSFLKNINGDTAINALSTQSPNMDQRISSILMARASSTERWYLYMYDQINRIGNVLAVTNASTTSNKILILSNLGRGGSNTWNNAGRSLCQYFYSSGGAC